MFLGNIPFLLTNMSFFFDCLIQELICFPLRFGYQMQLLEALLGAEKHYSKVKGSLGEQHKKQVIGRNDGMILAKINQSPSNFCTGKGLGEPDNVICH